MFSVAACPVPQGTLLSAYGDGSSPKGVGAYTDCYSIDINGAATLPDFVFAFYSTPVFKIERIILKYLVAKPSNDDQARQLADGSIDLFAAWSVEGRTENELLMCDFVGRTRSWFMVTPIATSGRPKTLLQFGSAVVPRENRKTGELELGGGFGILLGFHKLYSRVLLYSARLRLAKHTGATR